MDISKYSSLFTAIEKDIWFISEWVWHFKHSRLRFWRFWYFAVPLPGRSCWKSFTCNNCSEYQNNEVTKGSCVGCFNVDASFSSHSAVWQHRTINMFCVWSPRSLHEGVGGVHITACFRCDAMFSRELLSLRLKYSIRNADKRLICLTYGVVKNIAIIKIEIRGF